MQIRTAFFPVYDTINTIHAEYNIPAMKEHECSDLKKRIVPAVNMTKKGAILISLVISVIGAAFYSLIRIPYTCYKQHLVYKEMKGPKIQCFKGEITQLIESAQTKIKLEEIFSKDKNTTKLTPFTMDQDFLDNACGCMERSNRVYGPVIKAWVENLLELANNDPDLKLVFMARDGSLPYKAMLRLLSKDQKKYPNVTKDRIVLGYFSRKLVNDSMTTDEKKEMFNEYVTNTLNIKPNQKCLMVDVGFTGTMIDNLKSLMPTSELAFHYLISLTPHADGFIATKNKHLKSITSANSNLGVHWLEDTHQGNIKSPSQLVRGKDGKVYPNTVIGKIKTYCSRKNKTELTKEYLMRKIARKAVYKALDDPVDLKKAVNQFNSTLLKLKRGELPLFVEHL